MMIIMIETPAAAATRVKSFAIAGQPIDAIKDLG